MTFEIQASVPPHLVTSVTIRGSRSSRKHVLYNVMVRWPKAEDVWGRNVTRIYGPTDMKTAKKLRDEYRLVVEAAKVLHGQREVGSLSKVISSVSWSPLVSVVSSLNVTKIRAI